MKISMAKELICDSKFCSIGQFEPRADASHNRRRNEEVFVSLNEEAEARWMR
jgi:hypothetical protein